ncbi:MAG: ATP synthase F1 subunit delta [Lachnospiraceae bacterium]|nr:ATP synthase F1 subunit delta [Lachnospiraceae bacterium]
MTELSISYGVVLYELGLPADAIGTAERILKEVPEVDSILQNPTIDRKVKHSIIQRVFPDEIHNYLKQMCDYEHMSHALEAFEAFHDYEDQQKGRLEATLYYVTKPQEEQEVRMRRFLCEKYGCKDVSLSMVELPDLIGGFILKVGSSEYDWSIRGRMQHLKTKMIRR